MTDIAELVVKLMMDAEVDLGERQAVHAPAKLESELAVTKPGLLDQFPPSR